MRLQSAISESRTKEETVIYEGSHKEHIFTRKIRLIILIVFKIFFILFLLAVYLNLYLTP